MFIQQSGAIQQQELCLSLGLGPDCEAKLLKGIRGYLN